MSRTGESTSVIIDDSCKIILNSINDGIVIHDIDTSRFLYANNAMCKMIRTTCDRLKNMSVEDFSSGRDPYTIDHALDLLAKAASGMPQLFVWHFMDVNGRFFWGEVHLKRTIISGKPYVIAIIRDITDRKNAESMNERLGRILDSSLNEVFVFDHQTLKFTQVNRGARLNLGFSMDELRSMTPLDIKPDVDPVFFHKMLAMLKHGVSDVQTFETFHRRKDGSKYPVMVTLQYFDSEDPPVFVAVTTDITQRKSMEEKLVKSYAELEERVAERTSELKDANASLKMEIERRAKSEEELTIAKTSIDRAGESIFWMDSAGKIKYANEQACTSLGYTREELLSLYLWDVDPYFSVEHWKTGWNTISENPGQVSNTESVHMRKDGSVFPVDVSAFSIDFDGAKYIFAFARDITARKHAESTLERYKMLSKYARDIILFIRIDGSIIEANDAAIQTYGYTREEMLSMKIYDLRPGEEHGFVYGQMETASSNGLLFETVHVRKDGSSFPVEVSSRSYVIENETILLSIVRDITDRKHREEELKDAKLHAELYLDLMSHDINNMNQIGIGYLELAMDTISYNEDQRQLIEKPLEILYSSSRLIDSVKKSRSIKENQYVLKPIDIGSALQDAINALSNMSGKPINISYHGHTGFYVLSNDTLKDVFSNIIGNAIKHGGPDVLIEVRICPVNENGKDWYRVEIADNGPGIPDNLKVKIFNRLQRGDTRAKGSGVGLYLVRTLVESFNGHVRVEDRVAGETGSGSRFILTLPSYDQKTLTKNTGAITTFKSSNISSFQEQR